MIEQNGSTKVKFVDIVRRFDVHSTGEVESLMEQAIQTGARTLVADFSKTEYMSSAGIRVIITTAKKLQKMGGTLAFCCLAPEVNEVFRITGLLGLFQVFTAKQEAQDALVS